MKTTYVEGDYVAERGKYDDNDRFQGEVRAVLVTALDAIRYVVEDCNGHLRVFNSRELLRVRV